MNVYAIYDNKVEAHLTPFFARTNGEAIRMFASAVNQEGTDFHRWANDYCLYRIGSWDPQSGDLVAAGQNENLGLAVEYLKQLQTAQPANIQQIREAMTPTPSGPQN